MGKTIAAVVKWIIGHPQVIQIVVDAIKEHEAKNDA